MSSIRRTIFLTDDIWKDVADFVEESDVFENSSQFVRFAIRKVLADMKGENENETK